MLAAAAAGDFETAARLRDTISLLRLQDGDNGGPDVDPTGLIRQQPGAMGLGTSQPRVTPPLGWTAPRKPDPLTTGQSRPRGRQPKGR